MIYNIIGDIHGRTYWKNLVMDNAINIFIGDYFSPYGSFPFDDIKKNFLEIVEYKKWHPETILLIDSWKNQESLDAHHASPMMQELADLRKKYDLHMRVERYISDENGIPSSDQKFIRK